MNFGPKAILIISSIFWAVMPCSMLKVDQLFRETCHLHCCLLHPRFLVALFVSPEDGSDMFIVKAVDFVMYLRR
jgi:hypothetical protein